MPVRTRETLEGGEKSFDPSENVKALNQAAANRQDDLRIETNRRIDSEIRHLAAMQELRAAHAQELNGIREKHQVDLRNAEAARLDSIRQVDREDVSKTQVQAQNAIATLATTQNTTAETLRTQVATTAQAQLNTTTAAFAEVNKRLSALELSSSEGRGKATVESPMMAELIAEMKAMRREQSAGSGRSAGAQNLWAILAVVLGLLVGLAGVASRFL